MEMHKKQNKGTNYKWIYKAVAGIAACLVLCGGMLTLNSFLNNRPEQASKAAPSESVVEDNGGGAGTIIKQADGSVIKTVDGYDELFAFCALAGASNGNNFFQITDSVDMDAVAVQPSSAPESSGESSMTENFKSEETTRDYSKTNTQVKDVDEADIVKTDGNYIYTLSREANKLYIVKVDGSEMSISDTISLHEQTDNNWRYEQEFFIYEDRLLLISSHEEHFIEQTTDSKDCYYEPTYTTCVTIYDISDRNNVVEVSTLEQSGNYTNSRLVDGYLYLISSYYPTEWRIEEPHTFCPTLKVNFGEAEVMPIDDILVYEQPQSSSYTVITSISATDGTQFDSHKALLGSGRTLYCNQEHILLADNTNRTESLDNQVTEDGRNYIQNSSVRTTKLVLFDIDGGSIVQSAANEIEGSLLNQFSMDEYNGSFRIVVTRDSWRETIYTDGIDQRELDSTSDNALYVLDGELNIIGSIEDVAQDERVYSVRFDGDIGYFVTFRQTDPLFTVNLSDPYNPYILSELKIPGFSNYLHPYGEGLLMGIGYDADEETGRTNCIKMSMFDVSDKANVTEAHTLLLEDVYWSEATSNHKAILVDVQKNLIAFPAEDTYYVYSYNSEAGFKLEGTVDYSSGEKYWNYSDMRGLYIDNCFYVAAQDRITALDLTSFEKLSTLKLN